MPSARQRPRSGISSDAQAGRRPSRSRRAPPIVPMGECRCSSSTSSAEVQVGDHRPARRQVHGVPSRAPRSARWKRPEDAEPVRVEPVDDPVELGPCGDVDASGRLVEDQHLGSGGSHLPARPSAGSRRRVDRALVAAGGGIRSRALSCSARSLVRAGVDQALAADAAMSPGPLLSRTHRSSRRPRSCVPRAPARCRPASPYRMPRRTCAPSTVTLPRSRGCTPARVRSSRERPEPSRPARPTTSPGRMSRSSPGRWVRHRPGSSHAH